MINHIPLYYMYTQCKDGGITSTSTEAKKYFSLLENLEQNSFSISTNQLSNKEGCGLSRWTSLQSNLISLLNDMPLYMYLTHKELFHCSSIDRSTSLRHHDFTARVLTEFQQDSDDTRWVEFVGVANTLSQMSATIAKVSHCEDEVGGVYDNIESCLVSDWFGNMKQFMIFRSCSVAD